MRKYYIELSEHEAKAVAREADRSLREFKAEVRVLVRESLTTRGVLPANQPNEQGEAPSDGRASDRTDR